MHTLLSKLQNTIYRERRFYDFIIMSIYFNANTICLSQSRSCERLVVRVSQIVECSLVVFLVDILAIIVILSNLTFNVYFLLI